MKIKILFISFLFFISCNNVERCNCEKDCPNQDPIIVTSENSISSENLYALYQSKQKKIITEQLNSPDIGQLTDEKRAELKKRLKYAEKHLIDPTIKLAGGICPPCPRGICCSDFDYFLFNAKFNKVKLMTKTSHKTYKVGNQTIIPIKNIKGNNSLDSLTFKVKNYKGEDVNFNLIIN